MRAIHPQKHVLCWWDETLAATALLSQTDRQRKGRDAQPPKAVQGGAAATKPMIATPVKKIASPNGI
jgi:hypothetical protein